jgi:hypothetical protein
MPTIEITEEQAAYIEDLRAELEDHHVGAYGTVRTRDAVQFLIDHRESGATTADAGIEAGTDLAESSAESGNETDTEADESPAEDDEGAGGGAGRLNAMMQLLETHDDRWEEVESDQGKYAVTLPGGETEHVRTKDDVRALLFQHYD